MSWSYERDPAEEEWTHLSNKYPNYIKVAQCMLETTLEIDKKDLQSSYDLKPGEQK